MNNNLINKDKVIFITAGGTGGHVFPSKALLEALLKRGYDKEKLIFITDERTKSYGNIAQVTEVISIKRIYGGIVAKLKGLFSLIISLKELNNIFKKYNPSVVVAFGGYVTFPTLLMAKWNKVPIVLHEQNSVMGRVNVLMSEVADKIAIPYKKIYGLNSKYEDKAIYVGNPVRQKIKLLQNSSFPEIENGIIKIFVTGGSQGARILSEVVPSACAMFSADEKAKIVVSHQARVEDLDKVKKCYFQLGINAQVKDFFEDIEEKFKESHLIISRSGASSVAEISVIGRAAIFVPFKLAKDNHQFYNAKYLLDNNAAIVITEDNFTANNLYNMLSKFIKEPHHLEHLSKKASALGVVDADERLADIVEQVISHS